MNPLAKFSLRYFCKTKSSGADILYRGPKKELRPPSTRSCDRMNDAEAVYRPLVWRTRPGDHEIPRVLR